MIGERQAEAAEKFKPGGETSRGGILIADRGAAGVDGGQPETDQGSDGAAEVEHDPATGDAYVVHRSDLEPVASLFIDIGYLHSLENAEAGALTLFRWHTPPV